jgi:ATP-binding cassette subfamily B protein
MDYKKDITYKQVLRYYYKKSKVAGRRTPLLIVVRCIVLLAMIIEPRLITQVIKVASSESIEISQVWKFVWFIALTSTIEFWGWRLIEHWMVQAQIQTMKSIAVEAFGYIHRHWSNFFANTMSGSLLKRVKEWMDEFENLYDIFIFNLISPIWLTIGAVVIISLENIYLWGILAVRIVLYVTIQITMYHKKWKKESTAISSRSVWSWYLADTFSNHDTVQHMGNILVEEKSHEQKISDRSTKESVSWYYGNRIYGTAWLLMNILWVGGMVMIVYLWELWVANISLLVLFLLYIDKLLHELRGIGNVFKRLVTSLENWREYLSILKTPHEIQNTPQATLANWNHPSISIESIYFGYKSSKITSLFEDFTLKVQPYEKIGLVGESGSGKSSLIKLLLRLYEVGQWSISIGWEDIRSYTIDSLRSSISYIPQEPILFHRSIWENILYWKPDATREELIQATRRARAYEFIMQLPEGFDSLVWERGVKLSGWQRQRVAIARAILHDADIIIMDEATSALDSQTEKDIQAAMEEVMDWKTVIVIAHRLSTVKKLDRIVVLDTWKIIEEWTHSELVDMWWTYANMISLQSNF